MTRAHPILVLALVALGVLYATWFASSGQARDPAAALVFGLPPLLFAAATLRRAPRAPFWAAVFALAWFSHGVMVAWTRPAERGFALAEVALALVVVFAASLPGLRARFAGRRR
ncbi:DUF2069 domain-containing protein [Lysobacter sp. N42]|jgi:uncharacterized membrane protein|uniref:DUF2069 domain-containing protein n=1 Tax=Lysobacter sp. N42 TaxID=2545719 RepID=UPI00104D0850|nr:DUF2069 domain-containing protein [Lysobacter sp. N42]TCZ83418.1 DUF2069 domain-containing protein [Lysobacter sp. N42]